MRNKIKYNKENEEEFFQQIEECKKEIKKRKIDIRCR